MDPINVQIKLTNNQLKWFTEDDQKFEEIKRALIQAPVLSLPDLEKPFYLFVNTSKQTAYGVLTQDWAGIQKPVGYCSKLLDPVSRGWPACLQALVATALLIEEYIDSDQGTHFTSKIIRLLY
uniref:Reverse transcriptase/retrotransposon-derived protein RNase H-like domain-containing protein n=1 Tax=Anas zonorhyncha TaxID=75864 RepID=A0A8B9UUB8_9AVES